MICVFVQAEDGIRDLVRSRGLGDVYKRQAQTRAPAGAAEPGIDAGLRAIVEVMAAGGQVVEEALGGLNVAPAARRRVRADAAVPVDLGAVSYTHLRAHATVLDLVCRLLLEKKQRTRAIRKC